MNKFLVKIRDFIVEIKILIGRSTGYLTILNAGMLAFVFIESFKEYISRFGWYLPEWISPPFIFFASLFACVLGGAIEVYWMKGITRESQRGFELTPYYVDMKAKIDEMYENMKNGEKNE